MERIDITIKRAGGSPITLTFSEGEADLARERFEFLAFILRPFAEPDKKPVEKSKPGKTSENSQGDRAGAPPTLGAGK